MCVHLRHQECKKNEWKKNQVPKIWANTYTHTFWMEKFRAPYHEHTRQQGNKKNYYFTNYFVLRLKTHNTCIFIPNSHYQSTKCQISLFFFYCISFFFSAYFKLFFMIEEYGYLLFFHIMIMIQHLKSYILDRYLKHYLRNSSHSFGTIESKKRCVYPKKTISQLEFRSR